MGTFSVKPGVKPILGKHDEVFTAWDDREADTIARRYEESTGVANLARDPFVVGQAVPLAFPFVDDRRPVSFGKAVEMGQVEARFAHAPQHRLRWWGRGVVEGDAMRYLALLVLVGVE